MERASISEEVDQLLPDHTSVAAGLGAEARVRASGNEFEMPKALKRPRDVSYSVRSLYEDIKRGLIDVNPEYQRDVVWKTDKQMMLIDSVFTNHYMPPIILGVIYDDSGTEVRKVCLDGKQRLTSLQLFMDGLIPRTYCESWNAEIRSIPVFFWLDCVVKHPETLKSWWFTDADSSTTTSKAKLIIPERIRTSFANRQIRCTEYEELDEEDEREIFRRVQLGVALSSAEKLRVLHTRRAKFINELKEQFVTEDGLAAPSFRWERSRGADYRCLAQAVYVIFKWSTAPKNAGTLPQVEKWLEDDSEPLLESFIAVIKETFTIMVELTRNPEYSKPFGMYPKVSPIEIIGVLVLVYVHSVNASPAEKLNSAELSAAFTKMRRDVRAAHKDIRLNDRVGKTIVAFVKEYQKPTAAPAPVPDPVSAPQLPPSLSPMTATQSANSKVIDIPPVRSDPAPATDASKRKRTQDSSSDVENRAAKRFTASLPYDPIRHSTAVWSSSPLTSSSGSTQATAQSQVNRVIAPVPNPAPVVPAVAAVTYPPGTHPYWNPQMLPSPEPHFSQAPGQFHPGTLYRYTGPVPSAAPTRQQYPVLSGHNQASSIAYTYTPATPSSTSPNSTASTSALPSIAVKTEPDASPVGTSAAAKALLEQQQLNDLIGQQVPATQGPRPLRAIGTAQQDYDRSAMERRLTR